MCKVIKVRYACKHLGRTTTKRCDHVKLMKDLEDEGTIPKTHYLYHFCKDACQREKDAKEVEYDEMGYIV